MDGIPNESIRAMKPKTKEDMRHYFNAVLDTHKIPPNEKAGRVKLIFKGKGINDDLMPTGQ
ncbi:hypothetical protein HPB48_019200 [Haemaphysalis longicornis]|uniref:Uncharacterized protein n=1 Tax=Haemaphysalis longicornis TaxID=44386 RepID=A0A9J6GNB1_HAELO|nr:hypothetical protein HPB48_019200 [Haemaphysalis longicornis]